MKCLMQLALLLLFLSSCTKTEYVEIDVDPQLEIRIVDVSTTPVSGATVSLYADEGIGSADVLETQVNRISAHNESL